jgi:undecaprenyl-diphosphatase
MMFHLGKLGSSARTWFRNRDLQFLLAVLLVALGCWTFRILADQVAEGTTRSLDRRLILALRQPDNLADPIGPPWLEEAGRDFTAMGGYAVLTFVTATAACFLGILRKHHAAWLLVGATVGGLGVMHLLKALVNRPRPDLVPHLSHVATTSFPSGHAMLSAVVYLTLGAMLTRFVEDRRLKSFILLVALLLTFLIGVSRVYLGVHYPTDVLAGWTAGLVWAVVCWQVTRALQRRGAVESDRVDRQP